MARRGWLAECGFRFFGALRMTLGIMLEGVTHAIRAIEIKIPANAGMTGGGGDDVGALGFRRWAAWAPAFAVDSEGDAGDSEGRRCLGGGGGGMDSGFRRNEVVWRDGVGWRNAALDSSLRSE